MSYIKYLLCKNLTWSPGRCFSGIFPYGFFAAYSPLPAQLTIRAGEIAERVTPRFGNETYRTVRLHDVQTS